MHMADVSRMTARGGRCRATVFQCTDARQRLTFGGFCNLANPKTRPFLHIRSDILLHIIATINSSRGVRLQYSHTVDELGTRLHRLLEA